MELIKSLFNLNSINLKYIIKENMFYVFYNLPENNPAAFAHPTYCFNDLTSQDVLLFVCITSVIIHILTTIREHGALKCPHQWTS